MMRTLVKRLALAVAVLVVALLPTTVSPAASSPAPAAASCSLAPRSETVWVSGGRYYHLRVPAGLTAQSLLLVSLHPGLVPAISATPDLPPYGWERISGWTDFANQNKLVVAYPQGSIFNTWEPNDPALGDAAFLREVVADIRSKVCIDPRRIHIDGYSLGGWMAQRMACENPDIFASASSGGALYPTEDLWDPKVPPSTWPCQPSRPISIFWALGTADWPEAPDRTPQRWVNHNRCPAPTTQALPEGLGIVYKPCAGGTEVFWRSYSGYDHLGATVPFRDHSRSERYAFYLRNPRP